MSWIKNFVSKLIGSRDDAARASNAQTQEYPKLTPEESSAVNRFEAQFKIRFNDHRQITTALKHRSFLNMTNESRAFSNERLEFLGDAVLDLVVTHFLYQKFPNKTEGHLSKVKSILVSKPVMADIAQDQMKLGDLILMNRGEEKTGGRQRKSILADAFEAIIGAIYLDKGLDEAEKFIQTYLLADYKKILRKGLYKNYKSILLEHAQGIGQGLPEYRVVEENGPDHAKEFVISVAIGKEILGEGKGKSKKIAEQEAAKRAVKKLAIEEKM
ncbi:MAG: ribonuclease III [Calditrichaeota bacterium]|nr:ribonuclease III [Calditrichota bacterium]MCB0270332.1 ribonuclease III [Calditrichota bacterium]MCB0286980.1 ribonuclease III [Calditrichota bacterium]MCB0300163.1 ribonuclease III [Calditrichota bacterium]MCB9068491.1 ribonuclease III [Calditrichia bacterium]